jgi:plastocyanin
MSEQPTRERLLLPILIPLLGLVLIATVLLTLSRVLLRVTPTAATITALIVAASILGVATYVATRPSVSSSSVLLMGGGVLGIVLFTGGVALLVGQPGKEVEPVVLSLAAPQGAATKGFDVDTLTGPAGTGFTLAFDNQDGGIQHDVDIATEDPLKNPGATVLLEGAPTLGPQQIQYAVPALEAGKYYFFCSFHPTVMNGTLTIAAGAAPEEGGAGAVTVSAKDLAFSTKLIDLPEGQPGQITLQNKDPGVTHDIGIYSDQGYTQEVFRGPDVIGVSSSTFDVQPLEAGTYYFRCDYHPTMNGTVKVGSGETPQSGSPGSPSGGPSP